MQTKLQTVAESLLNLAVGFCVAFFTQLLVFPWFGMHPTIGQNFQITCIFTVVSFCRLYVVRRFFNFLHSKRG